MVRFNLKIDVIIDKKLPYYFVFAEEYGSFAKLKFKKCYL